METKKKGIGILFSDKKAKWVIGAVVGIALLAGLYFFHLPSAKTLILSVLLCVGCGLLIAANRFPEIPVGDDAYVSGHFQIPVEQCTRRGCQLRCLLYGRTARSVQGVRV